MTEAFSSISNPYVVGNPVKSSGMFFGREEDLAKIKDWITHDGPHVILLIGDRRSGKTSILWQILGGRLQDVGESILCDFHAIVPKISTDQDFPLEIANVILANKVFANFRPDFEAQQSNPVVAIQTLIQSCLTLISPRKLIILCDEFDALEELFKNGTLTAQALQWVRHILDLPVYFVMTSSHEFREDHVREVLGTVAQKRPIYELSQADALALIQRPIEGKLEYREQVAQLIYQLSGGQPFYTQYLCHTLINHVNAELKRPYVLAKDMDEVIDFIVHNPSGHIQETWRRISKVALSPPYTPHTLAALANAITNTGEKISVANLEAVARERRFNIPQGALHQALSWLCHNTRVVDRENNCYGIRIDLLRHWIAHEFQIGEDIDIEYAQAAQPYEQSNSQLNTVTTEKSYAEQLRALLSQGAIIVIQREQLDFALLDSALSAQQALECENEIRAQLNLELVDWVKEYKDSFYALSATAKKTCSQSDLARLYQVYGRELRLSKQKIAEIHQYLGIHAIRSSTLTMVGGGIVLIIIALFSWWWLVLTPSPTPVTSQSPSSQTTKNQTKPAVSTPATPAPAVKSAQTPQQILLNQLRSTLTAGVTTRIYINQMSHLEPQTAAYFIQWLQQAVQEANDFDLLGNNKPIIKLDELSTEQLRMQITNRSGFSIPAILLDADAQLDASWQADSKTLQITFLIRNAANPVNYSVDFSVITLPDNISKVLNKSDDWTCLLEFATDHGMEDIIYHQGQNVRFLLRANQAVYLYPIILDLDQHDQPQGELFPLFHWSEAPKKFEKNHVVLIPDDIGFPNLEVDSSGKSLLWVMVSQSALTFPPASELIDSWFKADQIAQAMRDLAIEQKIHYQEAKLIITTE